MNTLTEIAEFVEQVLRLDLETPIRGYDGNDIGPSNEQAQVLANRTLWLKKKLEELASDVGDLQNLKYVASVNKQTGAVTITYESIGAAAAEHKHKPSDIETSDSAMFVTLTEKKGWDAKQERLISGQTLKSVLGVSLLGEGNITIGSKDIQTDDDYQFISKTDREKWNNKQPQLVSGESLKTLHGKSLLGNGDVKLSFSEVGADESGAGVAAVEGHVGEEDPHTQYLTKTRGAEYFLDKNLGNKPNGYLKLDNSGNIPSEMADLFKARYIIADDASDRLKISEGGDMTICLQLDENIVYYLDAGDNPSVDDNWKKGRSTDPGNVISVFGRTGVIVAATGDYNTDQITETDNKTFVNPDDRTKWNGKQDKLTSGSNIRTINGNTLLGSTDIEITPESIGAAEKEHTHSVDDIKTSEEKQFISSDDRTNWDGKQPKLTSGKNIKTLNSEAILGEGNIEITPESISAANKVHKHNPSDIETDDENSFVSAEEKKNWNAKQDPLKSGTTIKTLNDESLLGEGNISITPESIGAAKEKHKHSPSDIETDDSNQFVSLADKKLWNEKQAKLVSGTNVKTIFGETVLGEGDIGASDVSTCFQGKGTVSISYDPEKDKIIVEGASAPTNDFIEVNIENAEAGDTYRYQTDGLNFNLTTKIFNYIDVVSAGVRETDYSSMQDSLTKNTLPTSNATGIFPTGSLNTVTLNSKANSVEAFESKAFNISSYPQNTAVLDVSIDEAITSFIPTFAGETSLKGFMPMAESNYNNLPPSSAFRAGLSSSEASKANDYWSSSQIWNQRTSDIYLGIMFTKPFELVSYSLQKVGGWYWGGNSAAMTGWSFQGRNSSDDSWVTLDRQSDQNLISSDGTWLTYNLNSPVRYSQYRFLLENVNAQGARPSIARVRFNHHAGLMIKDKNGNYYGLDNEGNLSQATISTLADFYDNQITEFKRPLDLTLLSDKLPFTFCTTEANTLSVTPGSNFETIAINVPIYKRSNWDGFKNVKMLSTFLENTSDKFYFAISPDGTNYYIWKDSKWTEVTAYETTTESVARLRKEGMSYTDFNNIPDSAWVKFEDLALKPTITMAVSDVIFLASDPVTPKASGTTLESVKGWKEMTSGEVSVVLIDGRIDFTTENAGTYKILYRFN